MMEGKVKETRTDPGNGSEQTRGSLVPRRSWGLGGRCGSAPQDLHPLPVALGTSPASGRDARRSGLPRRSTGHGDVRATGRREDAGAGRAPRVARALLATDTGGVTALRPRRAGAPRSIGGSRKLETCQPHSPGYLRRPRQAQAGAGTSKARVGPGSCDPLNLSPGAGGRRRAQVQGARGAEARRAHRRDQWDCSKWPAWAGHNPWRRDGTSEAGPGRTRAYPGDQSESSR